MIGYLSGKVQYIGEKDLILNVGGVGYRVGAGTDVIASSLVDTERSLWIFTNVKENEISLFGFEEKETLDFFEILIGVSGVGPKTALEVLSLSVNTLKNAIASSDEKTLTQIKGIGPKAAKRMILELKTKIDAIEFILPQETSSEENEIYSEAILALESLGFTRKDIVKSIRNAPEKISSEEIVRWFLKNQ